ncbi:MAG: endonuclease domain-containing protein [Armatimonadota bacterium]
MKLARKGIPVWRSPSEVWTTLKALARQMRREPTAAERLLWSHLRGRQLSGMRFRRQHAIDRFIADFYCAEARLVIELDGSPHRGNQGQDQWRVGSLESLGFRVLRFWSDEVISSLPSVLQRIAEEADEARGARQTSPPSPSPCTERGR